MTTFAGGAADIDLDFVGLDFNVHFLGFRQHGNGRGAGVNPTLRLGRWHALDAMHAALVFEPLENIRAGHFKNDFLETAKVGRVGIERLDPPFACLGVAREHPVKIGGEQRGFRTARAGANFNNRIARISRVRRHESELDLLGELFSLGFEPHDFLARELGDFGFWWFALEQRTVFDQLRLRFEKIVAARDQFFKPGVFLGHFLRALLVVESRRVAQRGLDFSDAAAEFFNVR